MDKKLTNPPRWLNKLLRLLCHEDLVETVEGDLFELYQQHRSKYGQLVALFLYLFNAIQFMRPFSFRTPLFYRAIYQNYFRVIFRSMKRNMGISSMNILGMTMAFLISISIFAYISHELSFDHYHAKANRVYRVTYRFQNSNGYDIHWARMNQTWVNELVSEFPEVEILVRFQSFRTRDISAGQDNYRENYSYAVDREVFDLFDFEILAGNKSASLRPKTVVLTSTAANKYFGLANPIGKTMRITNDQGQKENYEVTAVIKDPPSNSHLPIHLLTSINREEERRGWAYTYVLLTEGSEIKDLEAKISGFVAAHTTPEEGDQLTFHFQALTDIHLHSHLSREIVANGDIKNVMIFAFVGVFLLVIASVNFINLNMVRSMDRIKEFGLRQSLGAGRYEHRIYLLSESFVLSIMSALLALGFFWLTLNQFQQFLGYELTFKYSELLAFVLLSVVAISTLSTLLASLPMTKVLMKPITGWISFAGSYKTGPKRILLGLQFSTVLLLVTSMVIVQRQFSYMINKNLGYNSDQIMVLRNNSREVMRKYETLKTELKKFSEVKDITAVMEVPSVAVKDQGLVTVQGEPSNNISADMQVIDLNAGEMLQMEFLAGGGLPEHLRQKTDLPDSLMWIDFSTKPRGYLINETACRKLGWEPLDAVGKQINWSIGNLTLNHGPIAGVIKDFHQESLAEEIRPLLMTYEPMWVRNILVKTSTDNVFEWHDRLEHFWSEQFPEEPMQLSYLDEELERIYQSEKRQLQLISAFTMAAVFIAFMGLYVMILYAIKMRLKELAIRKVLGSKWQDHLVLLGKGYLLIAVVSMLIAFPLIYWAMEQWLAGYAYHISMNGTSFLLSGGLLLLLIMLTLIHQVIKNARTNPSSILASE